MRRLGAVAVVACMALGAASEAMAAHALPNQFQDQVVAGGLFEPIGMAFLPDGRLLVIERPGRVRLVVNGKLGAIDPLLAPDSVYSGAPESGLLGIAVDPGWPARPFVYVDYTAPDQTIRVVRYQAGGDLADGTSVFLTIDPSSRYIVLRDVPNHSPVRNGGGLQFGPDGALYVGVGDDSVECAAQDTVSLRGALLRLEVDGLPSGAGGPPNKSLLAAPGNPWSAHTVPNARLVWAIGFRDPYRFRIDPRDGTVLVGDIGSSQYQEVDAVRLAGSNFGWPRFEGPLSRQPACPPVDSASLTAPIYSYNETQAGLARVIGGDLYLATVCGSCDFPAEYLGDYFFADSRIGFLRRLKGSGNTWALAPSVPGQPSASNWGSGFQGINDLVKGPDGALWYCEAGDGGPNGAVGRIVHVTPSADVIPDRAGAGVVFTPPYPSPARGPVEMGYRLVHRARVDLAIYDAAGRRVRTLLPAASVDAGLHTIPWDGRADDGARLAAGVYVARLTVDGAAYAQRVPLLR